MNEVDSALSRVDAFANFYALNGGHASDEAKDAITLATEVHHLRARLQQVIIERDSWKSARDDLGRSNDRLQAELAASEANLAALQARWDARPSAASYDGLLATISEAAAQDAGVIATLEARVVRLADALETAYRHLDLSALRVSHAVDARVIENGFKSLRVTDSANVQQGKQK